MDSATRTVLHNPEDEEHARRGWYLCLRDRYVARQVVSLAEDIHEEKIRILDAGCGTGGVVHLLIQKEFDVVGVDADIDSLKWGENQGRIQKYECAELDHLPFDSNSFNLCVCSEVLEHLNDDRAGLREVLRVCRGPVVITVPAHAYLWTDSDRLLLHQRRYSYSQLLELIESAGGLCRILRPYGVLPGLAILLYKAIMKFFPHRKAHRRDIPLAARYVLPAWVNGIMTYLFKVDLWMSHRKLVPWGHAWMAIVDKPSMTGLNNDKVKKL